MTKFAVDDQTRRQLDEPQVVRSLLLPSHQQSSEAVEPTVAHLHYPPSRRMPPRIPRRRHRVCHAALRRDVRQIPVRHRRLPAFHRRIAPIQAEMPRPRRLLRSPLRHRFRRGDQQPGVQQLAQLLHVRPVRPRQHHRQRDAAPLSQEMPFAATLASVGRVRSRRFRLSGPPFFPSGALIMQPSAACHCQSSPTSSSYTASRCAHAAARQP